jgi:hypothetical protein
MQKILFTITSDEAGNCYITNWNGSTFPVLDIQLNKDFETTEDKESGTTFVKAKPFHKLHLTYDLNHKE